MSVSEESVQSRVIIIGVSSVLGSKIAEQCIAHGWDVAGTYRNRNARITDLEQSCRSERIDLQLFELDVLHASDVATVIEKLADRGHRRNENISIIYCCGKWAYGNIVEFDGDHFDSVIGVGLRAPFLVTASALRHFDRGVQLILITGLGGEKNAIASNAPYSITTNGIYSLVKCVGSELAGTVSSCIGVALGVFDKGQPLAPALGERLGIGQLPKLDGVASFIVSLIKSRDKLHNGAVIELTGGLLNYEGVIEVYERSDEQR